MHPVPESMFRPPILVHDLASMSTSMPTGFQSRYGTRMHWFPFFCIMISSRSYRNLRCHVRNMSDLWVNFARSKWYVASCCHSPLLIIPSTICPSLCHSSCDVLRALFLGHAVGPEPNACRRLFPPLGLAVGGVHPAACNRRSLLASTGVTLERSTHILKSGVPHSPPIEH